MLELNKYRILPCSPYTDTPIKYCSTSSTPPSLVLPFLPLHY